MSNARLAFALLVFLFAAIEVNAYPQNVTVKGRIFCNKTRVPNVQVILYEKDTLDPDDKLASTRTDETGDFELYGEEDEFTSISPYINIHHTCNVKSGCERISKYVVPKSKIGGTYDMTFISLEINMATDKIKCP